MEEQYEDFLVSKKCKEAIGDENASLQNSFNKFRERKKNERRIMKMCKSGICPVRNDEVKTQLRQKFVNTAMKYLGVPYAERFKAPDAPVAPLYLDCCGLIRKVLIDLQDDFGFVTGKWNQAYQMDTLPIILEQEDLKPGDLIFYEGLYNSKRSRPQKHNNVHVEIYLGGDTGEATIGSRYHKGVVSLFPSFKFKSTTWDLVKYHFRSLDTWLNGECRSYCSEHPWLNESLAMAVAAGSRSIFNDTDDDESAGGEQEGEEEEDALGGKSDDMPRAQSQVQVEGEREGDAEEEEAAETIAAPEYDSYDDYGGGDGSEGEKDTDNDNDNEHHAGEGATQRDSLSHLDTARQASDVSDRVRVALAELSCVSVTTSSSSKDAVQQGQASNSKFGSRAQHRERERDAALVKGASASSLSPQRNGGGGGGGGAGGSLRTKRLSKARASLPADEGSVRDDSMMSPSRRAAAASDASAALASCMTATQTTLNMGTAAGDKERQLSTKREASASLDSLDVTKKTCGPPHTYYVIKSNGWKLVKDALDKRGWQQLPFEYNFSSRYSLKWVERRSQIDYKGHQPGQLVCHIPNNDVITTKLTLLSTLRAAYCPPSATGARLPTPWLPETYKLEDAVDCTAALEVDRAYMQEKGIPCIWIYKPSNNNRGRGIRVLTGEEALREVCFGKPAEGDDADSAVPPSKGIVQRYIENPLLIGPDGYKFDVRCYLLIAKNFPQTLAFYHPGYCRLTLKPYSTSRDTLDDNTVHLTNAAIQKKDPLYKENKESQIQTPAALADTLAASGNESAANFMRDQLDHQMMLCMVDVLKAANPLFLRKHGYFDLLGCDFMVTADNELKLLEINTNPAMSLDNSTLENLLPGVIDSTIEIVLQAQGPDRPSRRKDDKLLLENLPGRFQLLFDESTGFEYGKATPARQKSKVN